MKEGIGHAVGLDEAHEMCINRDMKMAVVTPTKPYLQKTLHFFSHRIKARKVFLSQLFLPTNTHTSPAIWDSRSTTKKWEENVQKMRIAIHDNCLLPAETANRGLINVFTNQIATQEQCHDLLNARLIGEQGYMNFVSHTILHQSSVTKPAVRRKQLLTMAPPKVTRKRLSQQQKEQRETNKYLRRRLASLVQRNRSKV